MDKQRQTKSYFFFSRHKIEVKPNKSNFSEKKGNITNHCNTHWSVDEQNHQDHQKYKLIYYANKKSVREGSVNLYMSVSYKKRILVPIKNIQSKNRKEAH